MTQRRQLELPEVVEEVVDAHRDKRSPLLMVLQEIQHRMGYIPADAVPLVARELNLSRADVHGVVTFYRDFRSEPPARTTVHICRAEACRSVGAQQLVSAVEAAFGVELGKPGRDRSVDLEQVFCLGNCALGPAAQINGQVHGRLDRDRVVELVRAEKS